MNFLNVKMTDVEVRAWNVAFEMKIFRQQIEVFRDGTGLARKFERMNN